jgi:predicted ATP-grasp superfamily ATP-dependent carboligase
MESEIARSDGYRLLIAGGSARAAAASARRGALNFVTTDEYGDADLRQMGDWFPIQSLVAGELFNTAKLGEYGAWTYVGPWENWPPMAEALANQAAQVGIPLASADLPTLHRLRDPHELQAMSARAGLTPLAVVTADKTTGIDDIPQPSERLWIRKPLLSGGGLGVDVFPTSQEETWGMLVSRISSDEYLQEFASGQPLSVICLAETRSVRLIGWTEGIAGTPYGEHGYRGSRGSVEPQAPIVQQAKLLAEIIVETTGLRGLFGIDGIQHGDRWQPIEINPRYTASCEILELTRGHGLSLMREHVQAFGLADPSAKSSSEPTDVPTSLVGRDDQRPTYGMKWIVYAGQRFVAPDLRAAFATGTHDDGMPSTPRIADIPCLGTLIQQGHPVCTLFGWGASIEEAEQDCHWAVNSLKNSFPEVNFV